MNLEKLIIKEKLSSSGRFELDSISPYLKNSHKVRFRYENSNQFISIPILNLDNIFINFISENKEVFYHLLYRIKNNAHSLYNEWFGELERRSEKNILNLDTFKNSVKTHFKITA